MLETVPSAGCCALTICRKFGSRFLEGRPIRPHAEEQFPDEGCEAMPTIERPNCFAKLDGPAEYKGRAVKCKECGKSFVLRFTGRNKPSALKFSDQAGSHDKSTVSFQLDDGAEPPSSSSGVREESDRPPIETAGREIGSSPVDCAGTLACGDLSTGHERAIQRRLLGLCTDGSRRLCERLGYPVKPP